jgi:hypothetical protein
VNLRNILTLSPLPGLPCIRKYIIARKVMRDIKSAIDADKRPSSTVRHTCKVGRPEIPIMHPLSSPLSAPLSCIASRLRRASVLAAVLLLAACTVKDKRSVAVTPEVVPTEVFVAPSGLDSNPGTRTAPLRTLARAAQVVTPGTIVNVLPGTYVGGVRTLVDGRPNARIVFRSTLRWQARIVPPTLSTSDMAWDNRASHVDIEGFDVDGTGQEEGNGTLWRTGIYSAGTDDRIVGNHVHHIANDIPCTSAGGSGIGADSYYKGKNADVSGNSVHDIGPPACRFVHGIYIAMPAVVRNNVVYRVAEAGIHLWHDARDVLIANNTVTASHTGILVGGGDFYHTTGPNDGTRVLNNIVFDNGHGISEQGETGRNNVYRNNLVFGNPDGDWSLAPGMKHTGTVAAKPRFVDYARGGTPDFRLTPDSPAIGKGLPDGAPAADFNGQALAAGAPVDIGACQHRP